MNENELWQNCLQCFSVFSLVVSEVFTSLFIKTSIMT